MMALNDVWTLDVSGSSSSADGARLGTAGGTGGGGGGGGAGGGAGGAGGAGGGGGGMGGAGGGGGGYERLRWECVQVEGKKKPGPRGYHTANLVGNVMIVMGGSDGRECFSDIWCLDLGESP